MRCHTTALGTLTCHSPGLDCANQQTRAYGVTAQGQLSMQEMTQIHTHLGALRRENVRGIDSLFREMRAQFSPA